MGDWALTAGILLSYAGQWLKAIKGFPTAGAQCIIVAMALVLYALDVPPVAPWPAWLKGAIVWGLAVLGGSSLAAGVKAAPRTDSL